MFVDASVLVAVLNREPGWQMLLAQLSNEPRLYVSPMVRFEAVLAVARERQNAKRSSTVVAKARELVTILLEEIDAQEVPVSAEIGSLALDAASVYGKAVGHPADLNFGDCFAYACAKSLAVPLLYKGNDFAQTDLA